MAKRKLPSALRAHQFKKGSKKSKSSGSKGGRRKPGSKKKSRY